MFTCKQVSNALSKQDYASLPPHKRLAVKFHIAICVVCGKYNRQVMIMQDAVRKFRGREEEQLEKPGGCCLSKHDKDEMKKALHGK